MEWYRWDRLEPQGFDMSSFVQTQMDEEYMRRIQTELILGKVDDDNSST